MVPRRPGATSLVASAAVCSSASSSSPSPSPDSTTARHRRLLHRDPVGHAATPSPPAPSSSASRRPPRRSRSAPWRPATRHRAADRLEHRARSPQRYAVLSTTDATDATSWPRQLQLTHQVGRDHLHDRRVRRDGHRSTAPACLGSTAGTKVIGDAAQGAQAGDRTLAAGASRGALRAGHAAHLDRQRLPERHHHGDAAASTPSRPPTTRSAAGSATQTDGPGAPRRSRQPAPRARSAGCSAAACSPPA